MILERIHTRDDLLALTPEEDQQLCGEIREFLVQNVAKTGGHLASNLGIVELTLAIYKVYDLSVDRLLFDVGHQSYVHKMLSGRMDQFPNLREFGGMAGFPKPSESAYDAFIAGHASDSVSVALGMARARTLQKENYQVIALMGDGALSGGLAYEGLNDAGESGEPLVVILNDNGMSIDPNVGAMAKHLSRLRLKPGYLGLKKAYRQVLWKLPGGKAIYSCTHKIKNFLHRRLLGRTIFEEMGFRYLGPVDGHDLKNLIFLLKEAKEKGEPVLLHVKTKKGKGYVPAENTPESFHGIGRFDPETGEAYRSSAVSFSKTFGQTLCEMAKENDKICAITAAMEQGTGLSGFASQYPARFFDVGIAEGHAVSMAAGLAQQGMVPVFAVYSTFLQRSFDMLIHDISLLGLHVVFAVDRAGLVGEDGETHQGVFDVGFLCQVPGMQILCPANQAELRRLLRKAVTELQGPVAIRYPRGCDGAYTEDRQQLCLRPGSDVTILTYGRNINEVLEAAGLLEKNGIQAEVLKPDQIWPIDLAPIARSVSKTGRLLVVEEAAEPGCIGEKLMAQLSEQGMKPDFRTINLKNGIVQHGDVKSLHCLTGLDAQGIYQKTKEFVHETERTAGCSAGGKGLF